MTWGRVNRLSELEVSHMGSLQGAGEPAKYSSSGAKLRQVVARGSV